MSSSLQRLVMAAVVSGISCASAYSQKIEELRQKPSISIDEVLTLRKDIVDSEFEDEVMRMYWRFGITDGTIPKVIQKIPIGNKPMPCGGRYLPPAQEVVFYLCKGNSFDLEMYKPRETARDEVRKEQRRLIRHEVGHHYFFIHARVLGTDYWDKDYQKFLNGKLSRSDLLSSSLVLEGTAEYMARYGHKDYTIAENIFDQEMAKQAPGLIVEIAQSSPEGPKMVGYHLVKPILDKNFHKGMKMLILNPIKVEELDDLPRYQSRMMKLVSE